MQEGIEVALLSGAIDGITKAYFNKSSVGSMCKDYSQESLDAAIMVLLFEGLLAKLSDENGCHVAYRTTDKGIEFLKAYASKKGILAEPHLSR